MHTHRKNQCLLKYAGIFLCWILMIILISSKYNKLYSTIHSADLSKSPLVAPSE